MTAEIVTAEAPAGDPDFLAARTTVIEKLKKSYGVSASQLYTAMAENEELDIAHELWLSLFEIDVLDLSQLNGAAAAIAFILCNFGDSVEDDPDEVCVVEGSNVCCMVACLAMYVEHQTGSAACELVRNLFGEEAGKKFYRAFDALDAVHAKQTKGRVGSGVG